MGSLASGCLLGSWTVRVLVTNDDGVTAPGLAALTRALVKWAEASVAAGGPRHEIVVVAPSSNYSGAGAAVGQPVRPWSQYLPPAAVGPLIGPEAVDDRPRPHGVGPQRGADLAHNDVVTPVPDAPLLAGRRGNGDARGGEGHGAVN